MWLPHTVTTNVYAREHPKPWKRTLGWIAKWHCIFVVLPCDTADDVSRQNTHLTFVPLITTMVEQLPAVSFTFFAPVHQPFSVCLKAWCNAEPTRSSKLPVHKRLARFLFQHAGCTHVQVMRGSLSTTRPGLPIIRMHTWRLRKDAHAQLLPRNGLEHQLYLARIVSG